MSEPENPFTPLAASPPMSPAIPPKMNRSMQIFWGPNGLRAGWRVLIFLAICAVILFGVGYASRGINGGQISTMPFSPQVLLASEATLFGIVLLASWIMSKAEGRALASYGIPWRHAFRGEFWKGAVIGFAAISALLGALRLANVFHLGSAALHGSELWKYASLWAGAFLGVAFFEEFLFRGYALFTLTTGIGFWPAALLCSAVFGGVHIGNSGETWVGACSAGAIGLLFCAMLRRTGDLWMPIGFHAAWDWGETFFYGVPDSGQVAPGHLFSANLTGPTWLTGGSVGPEASWLCLILILCLFLLFAAWKSGVRYPDARPGSGALEVETS